MGNRHNLRPRRLFYLCGRLQSRYIIISSYFLFFLIKIRKILISPGTLQPHKWENCFTIDRKSWGFRRNAALNEYFTATELISELVKTVSCGGNFLLNVGNNKTIPMIPFIYDSFDIFLGPTRDGLIAPIFEERLRQIGQWMAVNGEAIYGSVPWTFQNDSITPDIW